MNRILLMLPIVGLLAGLFTGRLLADEPATQPSTQPSTFRDPTEAAPELQDALNAAPGGVGNHPLPQITLRGLVLVDGKAPMALIDVQEQGPLCIHEGSILTAGTTALEVVAIGEDQIQLQIIATHQTIVIH